MVRDDRKGDLFMIDGMKRPIPMGLIAAAGKAAEELTVLGIKFEELHRGGWDPKARMADQDRDGVAAEVIYPTVGMMLCNPGLSTTKRPASTLTICGSPEYCAAHPDRLIGTGQTAMRSVEEGIEDLHASRTWASRA